MAPKIISKQFGCAVTQIDEYCVVKFGIKVWLSEEAAMRLVAKHAPSILVPELYHCWYRTSCDFTIG